jgi:hypothetical protein
MLCFPMPHFRTEYPLRGHPENAPAILSQGAKAPFHMGHAPLKGPRSRIVINSSRQLAWGFSP